MESKSIWLSKTFWVNAISLVAMTVQGITGSEFIGLELQAGILSFVNILLRVITKKPVTW
jgi:hypothetical protein